MSYFFWFIESSKQSLLSLSLSHTPKHFTLLFSFLKFFLLFVYFIFSKLKIFFFQTTISKVIQMVIVNI